MEVAYGTRSNGDQRDVFVDGAPVELAFPSPRWSYAFETKGVAWYWLQEEIAAAAHMSETFRTGAGAGSFVAATVADDSDIAKMIGLGREYAAALDARDTAAAVAVGQRIGALHAPAYDVEDKPTEMAEVDMRRWHSR